MPAMKSTQSGAPERIRTTNLLIRSQMLYPVELRAPEREGINLRRRQRPSNQARTQSAGLWERSNEIMKLAEAAPPEIRGAQQHSYTKLSARIDKDQFEKSKSSSMKPRLNDNRGFFLVQPQISTFPVVNG